MWARVICANTAITSPAQVPGAGGKCPDAFPIAIPAVTFSIAYPTSGTKDGFSLASGMASSMHGDAFLAWEDDAMAHRVKDCVVQVVQCNTAGEF